MTIKTKLPGIDDFREYLHNAVGKPYDIYYKAYNDFLLRMEQDSDKQLCFKELLTWSLLPDGKYETPIFHTEEEYESFINNASKVMKGVLDNLISSKPSEDDFYRELYKVISMPLLFQNTEDRIGAILYLINSPFIPYYSLEEGIKMDEQEFRNLTKETYKALTKLVFILYSKIEQRTEVASLILKVFDEIEDPKAKAVLMANFIGYFEFRIQAADNQDG